MRLVLRCAAYVLHQQLRTEALQHSELASAQPISVILKLFKVATQVKQYKDRVILHLPSAYPFKHLLWQLDRTTVSAQASSLQFFLTPIRPASREQGAHLPPIIAHLKFTPEWGGGSFARRFATWIKFADPCLLQGL